MGGKGGGGSAPAVSQPQVTPSPYEAQLASMASDLYGSTSPLRQTFIDDWMKYLNPQKVLREGATPIGQTPNYTTVSSPGTPGHYEMGGMSPTANTDERIDAGTDQWGHTIWQTGHTLRDESGNGMGWVPTQGMSWVPGTEGTSTQQLSGSTPQYSPNDYITQQYNPNDIPGYTPAYDIGRRGLETSYNTALESTLANTPRGGALSDAINQVGKSRAESVGELPVQLSNQLIQDMINKAYGASWQLAPATATSAAGSAASSLAGTQNALISGQAMMNAAQIQANAAANSGKGSGLGALGMGLGSAVGRWAAS